MLTDVSDANKSYTKLEVAENRYELTDGVMVLLYADPDEEKGIY